MTEPSRPRPTTIRLATNADVLAMAKVHISSWRETYPGILPKPMLARLSIADEAIRWQRLLDHPHAPRGSIVFVADQHDSIVGYGSCGEQRTEQLRNFGFTAEIGELYVLHNEQRQGAGSALMQAMVNALIERGHRAMSLWVLEKNEPARRFYERLGGTTIAEKRAGIREVAYGWPELRGLSAKAT